MDGMGMEKGLNIKLGTLLVALCLGGFTPRLVAQGPPVVLSTSQSIATSVFHSYRVVKGGELSVQGVLHGDVVVEKGGRFSLQGLLHGNITNLGGEVKIAGHVSGRVIKRAGPTEINPKAGIEGGISE